MKRLIICSDGTWNHPDIMDGDKRHPTNVVKMARCILPIGQNDVPQVVFYDQGVGTDNFWDKLTGGIMGSGLSKNIVDAYTFLVHNYVPGDEIFLFGFSRGAYTVRSLAGMIGLCGLLDKNNAFFIWKAFEIYRLYHTNQMIIDDFWKKRNPMRADIKFIGVWDTVGAMGIPINGPWDWLVYRRHGFHNTKLGKHIRYAYQALAIDEKRNAFKPVLWELEADNGQVLEQRWFAGVHSNVGGSYNPDGLANITFHWMVDKASKHGLAISEEQAAHFKPVYYSILRNNMKKWFFGKYIRPIGKGKHSFEGLDESVKDRYQDKTGELKEPYRPSNLIAYLKKHGLLELWS